MRACSLTYPEKGSRDTKTNLSEHASRLSLGDNAISTAQIVTLGT